MQMCIQLYYWANKMMMMMAWPVKIAAATLSGNSLGQTVHIHRAFVHQAAKLVAALLRVARVTAGLAESIMAAFRRVYDSCHLQADCHEVESAPVPPYAG